MSRSGYRAKDSPSTMRILQITAASLLLLSAQPSAASAAAFIAEENLVITAPISDDTYAAGGNVRVGERIAGDLIIAGGNITVDASVSQDLTVAGGEVDVRGSVGDDVRAAGGTIEIEGAVGGDVIVFGGQVFLADTATVGGDLVINGGDVTVQGRVRGNVIVNAGTAYLENSVGGSLTFRGGELYVDGAIAGASTIVADSLRIGPDGFFSDPVTYWTPSGEFAFGESAPAGAAYDPALGPSNVEAEQVAAGAAFLAAVIGALAAYSLLSAALFIALIVLLTKTFFADAAKSVLSEPWKNMLYGVLYIFVTPMVVLTFLLSFIGIPIAVSVGLLYFISLFFVKYLTSIVLARALEIHRKWKCSDWQRIGLAVLVYCALSIAGAVPVVGWLLIAAAITISIGALLQAEWSRYLKVR